MKPTFLFAGLFLLYFLFASSAKRNFLLTDEKMNPFSGAEWISASPSKDSSGGPCPVFKKHFCVRSEIKKAELYITAHGVYEATLNSKRISEDYFAPGYTPYDKRLLYQTYDITSQLQTGKIQNEISLIVGDGWYRGLYGTIHRKNNYGEDASVLCKLLITYKDDSRDSVVSDGSWQWGTGSILRSNIYFGEMQDDNISEHGFELVVTGMTNQFRIEPQLHEPVTAHEKFSIKNTTRSKNGGYIFDFGQGIAGWIRINIKGKQGDTIKITHGEWLDKNGNLFTKTVRNIDPTDVYILNGKGTETFQPHFTYHGFRYAKIAWTRNGKQIDPRKEFIEATAIALHTDLKPAGTFSCSDPLINQLQHNIWWSINSNYFDIPTDCADRGERMGWTGDAEVMFNTAAFNYDIKNFFEKWLADLSLEQGVTGAVPRVVPDIYQPLTPEIKWMNTAAWGDAATIIPMKMYEWYGDKAILQKQYVSMKAWVRYELSRMDPKKNLWTDFGFGDWLAMGAKTDSVYINQCYLIHSLDLLLQSANILQLNDPELPGFQQARDQCWSAYLRNFVTQEGKIVCNTQTSYLLALQFNLLPKELELFAANELAQLIHQNNDHIATGFLGTPLILPVLSKYGYTDLAYKLLKNEDVPSWLYPVKMGATTCWEYWDAIHPDGTIDTTYSSPSLNQVAYATVGQWLYQYIGGISSIEPGYKKIKIAPGIGGGLAWAKCSYQCQYGKIVSDWKIENNSVHMHVEIPQGTTAVVYVPGKDPVNVIAGSYDFVELIRRI